MKSLTKEQQLLKIQALDIISDITSVRNPNRISDMEKIVEMFGPVSQLTKQKKP